jgi:hypothetical protein
MILDYLTDLFAVKHNHEVIGNIKSRITSHCIGSRKGNIIVAKDIVCTFAANQSIGIARVRLQGCGYK